MAVAPVVQPVIAGLAGALTLVVVGLPALRVPGLSLAVTTLGLAVIAPTWLFRQGWLGSAQAFGLTVDVGHLVCNGELPVSKFLTEWKNVLWNVHIEDMKSGVHDHLMFGEGDVDFADVFAGLRAASGTIAYAHANAENSCVGMVRRRG